MFLKVEEVKLELICVLWLGVHYVKVYYVMTIHYRQWGPVLSEHSFRKKTASYEAFFYP